VGHLTRDWGVSKSSFERRVNEYLVVIVGVMPRIELPFGAAWSVL
jgi:hypothetical protein